jgi:Domain of unknown function (DUF4129)
MKDSTKPEPAQHSFNWIENLAIPIASSIMETQPIIILLLFWGPLLVNIQGAQVPINEVELTLILLGMQWWALFVQHLVSRGMDPGRTRIFQIAGLCAALLIFILLNVFTANNLVFALVIVVGSVLWAWKRGIDRTRTELNEEQLIQAFRIGFIIIIALLMFTTILPSQSFSLPTGLLAQVLPLFVLSGLLAISFTRLLQIQQDNARHPTGKKDSTRTWALALTGIWVAVVAIAIALETFSFTLIQRIILPIWNFIGTLVLLIIEGIFFIISFLLNLFPASAPAPIRLPNTDQTKAQPSHPIQHPKPPAPSPELILIGRIFLLVLVVVAILIFVRLVLGRVRTRVEDDSEEEERESLDIGAILNERREERQKRRQKAADFTLEELEPNSARARYRGMLLALEEDEAGLAKLPAETPQEYQRRLALAIRTAPPSIGQPDAGAPAELEVLEELTRAYVRERYGAKEAVEAEKGYLGTWVPYLIRRLHRPKPVVQRQVEEHWGPN